MDHCISAIPDSTEIGPHTSCEIQYQRGQFTERINYSLLVGWFFWSPFFSLLPCLAGHTILTNALLRSSAAISKTSIQRGVYRVPFRILGPPSTCRRLWPSTCPVHAPIRQNLHITPLSAFGSRSLGQAHTHSSCTTGVHSALCMRAVFSFRFAVRNTPFVRGLALGLCQSVCKRTAGCVLSPCMEYENPATRLA